MPNYKGILLEALTDKGGECTRTQLLNQMQSKTDISPYTFISTLDALQRCGEIDQWEEYGIMYIRKT